MQYNLCIVDTLELFISVLIIRVYLIIQVSLQLHTKAHFGTMTKCVDYVARCPYFLIKRFQCTYICDHDCVNRENLGLHAWLKQLFWNIAGVHYKVITY